MMMKEPVLGLVLQSSNWMASVQGNFTQPDLIEFQGWRRAGLQGIDPPCAGYWKPLVPVFVEFKVILLAGQQCLFIHPDNVGSEIGFRG